VTFLRKQHGSRLNVFAPLTDLSTLSKTGSATRSLLPGRKNDVAIAGGQILGDEYSDHVVKVRRTQFYLYSLYLTIDPNSTAVVLFCVKGQSAPFLVSKRESPQCDLPVPCSSQTNGSENPSI
jgi:hypothetical protein